MKKIALGMATLLIGGTFCISGCTVQPRDEISNVKPPVSETEKTEPVPTDSRTELTAQQIAELEAFLNDVPNNGLLGGDDYEKPEDINLYYVLYDGGGISEQILTEGAPLFKLKCADVDAFLREKLGVSLDDVLKGKELKDGVYDKGLIYVKEDEAFYMGHGDTRLQRISIYSGEIGADGLIRIQYTGSEIELIKHSIRTLTLRPVGDTYQFVSDVENK